MLESTWEQERLNSAMHFGLHPQNPTTPSSTYSLIFVCTNPDENLTATVGELGADESIGSLLERMKLDSDDIILRFHTTSPPPHCPTCANFSSHWVCDDVSAAPRLVDTSDTGASLGLALGSETHLDLILKSTEVLLKMEYTENSSIRAFTRVIAMRIHTDSVLQLAAEEAEKHFGDKINKALSG